MASRRTDSYFSHLPTLNFPRSRFKMQTIDRKQSQSHGTLTPFFIDIVYPGDTWSIDTNIFCRADISVKVPLDTIYLDTYYFYIPFRILDKDFEKILGGVDAYDTNTYSFPQYTLENLDISDTIFKDASSTKKDFALWFLPFYLNYHLGSYSQLNGTNDLKLMSYGPMAYYMVFNEFFRDENVDHIIPIEDIKNESFDATSYAGFEVATDYDPDKVVEILPLLQVNKYHDFFTSSILSPQKGPEVTIPLGLSAPIVAGGTLHSLGSNQIKFTGNSGAFTASNFYNLGLRADSTSGGSMRIDTTASGGSTDSSIYRTNLEADLRNAVGPSINQFALALKLEQLYQRRAIYGTRLTEIYRGQWGLNVPDDLIDRPEYLGGIKVDLNNIPVLNTTSSGQGTMVGNSATLCNDGGFTKSFLEYGIIIGVSATRVKHTYAQGSMTRLHDLKDGIDLYNPIFANLGPQAVLKKQIFNNIGSATNDKDVFAYQEAWADLREGQSNVAGVFDPVFLQSSDFQVYWSFADYYASAPTFSSAWLKESPQNVCRTLSGNLIPGAPYVGGHQYLFDYQSHVTVYRELPARSRLTLLDRY